MGALPHNPNECFYLHADMNASFASANQQAFPLWRDKPLGVTPVNVPGGAVISPSYELKALGVKTGTRNRDARLMGPGVVLRESTPPLYRQMHREFARILRHYTPDVYPLSIDEALLDLKGCPALKTRSMEGIAREIKRRVREEMGEHMRISVGISTNALLAKVAAGLDKPDGLRRIDASNAEEVLYGLKLTDLPGIAGRNEGRLNQNGVFTVEEFRSADARFLSRQVFGSVEGWHWTRRLRGYQDATLIRGWQKGFSASVQTDVGLSRPDVLLGIVHALTLRASTKMRRKGQGARFLQLMVRYRDGTHFRAFKRVERPVWTAPEAFRQMTLLFNRQENPGSPAVKLIVDLSDAVPGASDQLTIFDIEEADRERRITEALDAINFKYGPYTLRTGLMVGAAVDAHIHDRIPFGSVSDVEELYADEEAWAVPPELL